MSRFTRSDERDETLPRGRVGSEIAPRQTQTDRRSAGGAKVRSTEVQGPDARHQELDAKRPLERGASERAPILGRGFTCRVSPRELEALHEIGRFRTVAVEDLVNHRYGGNASQMQQDMRSLAAQGLLQTRTVWLARGRGKLRVLVLSRSGKEVLERQRGRSGQALYAGFVKPAEVAHDAAIYRMFHKEASRIEENGGRIQRVVLDYEFKRKLYSRLAKANRSTPGEYARYQAQAAQENGLRVVRGKIPLPDLRVEYETASGELARVDLELATHHYHGSHLRIKAEAGFKMYGADGASTWRSAPLDEPEITAEILSL